MGWQAKGGGQGDSGRLVFSYRHWGLGACQREYALIGGTGRLVGRA